MNKQMTLVASLTLAATLPGSPAFASQGAAPVLVVASVGHSEWCRTGTARLDLGSGRYRVTAPRSWRSCRRPAWAAASRTGVLPADGLAAVRAAYRRAETEGLENPACRNGGRPETIVISNGGTPDLRLALGARAMAPPHDPSCWSEAALRLHRVLEDLFDPRR